MSLPSIRPDEARSIILRNVVVSIARYAVSGCSVGAGVVVSAGVSIEMIVCVLCEAGDKNHGQMKVLHALKTPIFTTFQPLI